MNLHALAGLTISPHPSFRWLFPFFPIAIALIIYLYAIQRRIVPRRTATTLTILRGLMVGMLFVLFLQPALTWLHNRSLDGELWLLVDQSPSMRSTDPQSSLAERVHWAEALDFLDKSARPAKPDLVLANFTAVAGDLSALRPTSATLAIPASQQQETARTRALSEYLSVWEKRLGAVRTLLSADSSASDPLAADALNAMDRAIADAKTAASAAGSATSLHEADSAVPWSAMGANLTFAAGDLERLSAALDATFVHDHGGDAAVWTAAARVSNVSRSDLAGQFLTSAVKHAPSDKTVSDLVAHYRVRVATFADSAQTTAAIDPSTFAESLKSALMTPSGVHATNMVSGLQAIAEQLAPDQPAAVIIVSDGRHNAPGDPTEPARLLAARGVRVYGLLTGSHEVSPDAAVDQIDAPDWVFMGDTLHATANLRLDGLAGQTAHVEFRRGGVVLDSQTLTVHTNQESQRVDFHDTPPPLTDSASVEYEVHIAEMRGEVNVQNNRSSFRVAIKKDKLLALYIDDRPRWEYRYLSAYLSRDQRLKTQTVLLNPATVMGISPPAPVKASLTNPRLEAQLLPQTHDEWQAFDLIILGDIPPGTLSAEQQQFIASAVRDKGATLITIAGQRHMPGEFSGSPLADLLPVTLQARWSPEAVSRHMRFGFRPALAPEGNASVLGQFGLSADSNANLWSDIPTWYWHSGFTQAKQAASVIWSIPADGAEASGNGASDARNNALLATMPVGIGRSLYLASDQTWRLRQVFGTNVHDRFWGQVLRWAVGSDLPAGGKFVRFGASQPTYAEGQPVTITARVLREDLTPATGVSFSAVARQKETGSSVEGRFVESTETPGYYHATLGGLPAGDNEISLAGAEVERLLETDPSVTQKTLVVKILPQLDLEQRNMNTDPVLLARVTQAGGGFAVDANYADVLASHIPAIQQTETTTEQIGFFTNPEDRGTRVAHWVFLGVFAGLLTAEWVIRKRAGLV